MIAELQKIVDEFSLGNNTPGFICLGMSSQRNLIEYSVGSRNEQKDPITNTSNFRIASITKQFTAVAILQLIEKGQLTLSTTVCEVFTDFPTYGQQVTIKHLLTHTSGLLDYEELAVQKEGAEITDYDVLQIMLAQDHLIFTPGTSYHYSNTGYCILAQIVENVSGSTYEAYLSTNVFPQAEMHTAKLGAALETAERVYGYSKVDGEWQMNDQGAFTATNGDGGIYASAEDLMNWQKNLYEKQTLITHKNLTLMTTPHIRTNYAGEDYGFGIAVTTLNKEVCYLHHGVSTGFETALFYLPNRKVSLAILSNTSGTTLNAISLGKEIIVNHLLV